MHSLTTVMNYTTICSQKFDVGSLAMGAIRHPLGLVVLRFIGVIRLHDRKAFHQNKIGHFIALSGYFILWLVSHWQYGTPTSLPWGISVADPAYRYHPVNVYRMILMVPLLVALYKLPIGVGKMASVGLIGYGSITLIISILQPKSAVVFNLSANQLTALLLVVVGMIILKQDPGPRRQNNSKI